MADLLQNTLAYLEYEQIKIDKREFAFQFKSHPNYPTLLALSDTLKFFRIENGALKVGKSYIESLPNAFMANIQSESSPFSFVKRNTNSYEIFNYQKRSQKKISKKELEHLWKEIVFLVEDKPNRRSKKASNFFNYLYIIVLALLFLFVTYTSFTKLFQLVFYIFPILGLTLSIGAFKVVLNSQNKFLSKLCNITSHNSPKNTTGAGSNCNTVIKSAKWWIFEKLDFTDLSLTFFATQILALFFMGILSWQSQYFSIQLILLILSVPFMFVSIFYQRFVVKNWCVLCLAIIVTLISEIGFLMVLRFNEQLKIDLDSSAFYLLIYTACLLIWKQTKTLLIKKNDLEQQEIISNQLKRNYPLFKRTLISNDPIDMLFNPIGHTNKEARLQIDILINPHCGYCKKPVKILQEIIENYEERINISYFHNIQTIQSNTDNANSIIKNLLSIHLRKGINAFNNALEDWYEDANENRWLEKYSSNLDVKKIDEILEVQNQWCRKNKLGLTPTLFINGYQFPRIYDISDLPFFINELLDDKDLLLIEKSSKLS